MIVDVNTTIAARNFDSFDVGDCFIDKDGDIYLKAFQKSGCVAVNLINADVLPPTMFDGEVLTPIILKVVNAQ
mgnify:FL=1